MKFSVNTVAAICIVFAVAAICILFAVAAILFAASGYLEPTPAELCRRADMRALRHQFDSAQRLLKKAIELQSDYAPARLQLAQVQIQKRAFSDALADYHAALNVDPMLAATSEFKNFVIMAAGVEDRDGFLAAYAALAEKLPAGSMGAVHAAAYDLAARVHFYRYLVLARELSTAVPRTSAGQVGGVADDVIAGRFDAVRKTISQQYDGDLAKQLLERVDQAEKHCRAAQQMSRKALEIDPQFAAARLGQAMMAIQMKSAGDGLQIVLDVLAAVRSPRPNLLLYAALLLERVNRFDDAEKLVRQVLSKDPANAGARYLWAGILLHQGDVARLDPLVDEFLRANPGDNRAVFLKGIIETLHGRYNQAAKYLGSVQGDLEGWDTYEYYRVLANYRTGNIAQARSSRLICAPPDAGSGPAFDEALLVRAALAIAAADPAAAADACRALLERSPSDPDALRLLAVARIMQRRPADAIATLRDYLKLRPGCGREMQALAAARMATGELNGVIAEYEQMAALPNVPPDCHRVLALACSLAGRPQDAENHYRSLLQFDPSQPDYWLYRARRLALEGRANGLETPAVAECRAGLARGASAPELLATIGLLNTMAGRFAEARDELAIANTVPARSQFIVDVYFALASRPDEGGPASAAAEILTADPFSRRSYDLLIIACSPGLPDPDLRAGLDKMARGRPGLVSLLNRAVVLRRQEAIHACSLHLVNLDAIWPRLTEVHKKRALDWM